MNVSSRPEILKLFEVTGESIAHWSRTRGFNPALVYRVLRGDTSAKRGQTHQIAIALGLKRPPTESEQECLRNGPTPAPVPGQAKENSM